MCAPLDSLGGRGDSFPAAGPTWGNAMIVRNIVDTKQIKQIVSAKPTDTVRAAIEILTKHRIGAVIVSRDGAIVDGILSERDIVRALGTQGVECLAAQVQDLMTAEVIGCHPEDTVNAVMEKMTDGRFRHMPVIEDNRMVAVISIGDAVKARISEIQQENSALTGMIANSW
jgi:CBS domain-containing protein